MSIYNLFIGLSNACRRVQAGCTDATPPFLGVSQCRKRRRESSFMIWLCYCGTLLVPALLQALFEEGDGRSSLELIILAWGRQRWVHINVGKLKNHCLRPRFP
ncbi:Uncharacterized protein Rs2_15672 [Raphanus sativus]|nr:Uncharacterized protein Rs2_15672 [Raphanus sativus]